MITFTLFYPDATTPTTTVVLPAPERGNEEEHISGQQLTRTRSGARVVYNRGSARIEATYNFPELTDSEKQALQNFYDTVDGMNNQFEITDHHGNTWCAKFNSASLKFTNTDENPLNDVALWSVAFDLELTDAT